MTSDPARPVAARHTLSVVLVVDLAVCVVIVACAVRGWSMGVGRALPVAGFAVGVVLGSRTPLLVGMELDGPSALLIALPAALLAGAIVAALAERLARPAVRLAGSRLLVAGSAGALLVGASAAVAAWALAPAVSQLRPVRDDIQRSEILERFNAALTPAGPPRQRAPAPPDLARSAAGKPRPATRKPKRAAREPRLLSVPAVRRADASVVKVVTRRCDAGYQGSGWIAGHGIVVTNAHVVTASTEVTVVRRDGDMPLPAKVVWFDGIHDLALLRVPQLRSAPGLALAADTTAQTPGYSLGFPSGRKMIRRARLGATTTKLRLPRLKLANNAGISLTMSDRLVTVIRGVDGPGGSGGPVIDRHGNVMATVFAGIPQYSIILAVPNRIVRSAMRRADHPVTVPACGAPPLKPTPKASIAARNA